MMTRFGRLVCSSLIATTLVATPAFAQQAPADDEFTSAKTVGVQPVLVTGTSEDAGWAKVANAMSMPLSENAAKNLRAAGAVPMPTPDEGFGFAGKSKASDTWSLYFGYVMGRMASHAAAGDMDGVQTMAKWLNDRMPTVTFLAGDVQAAAKLVLSGAMAGKVDQAAVVQALRAGQDGIAIGPQRPHGYFVAGMWAGLSMAAAAGAGADELAAMAPPLMVLLEEDAAFEGSDLKVAATVKKIHEELSKDAPDARKVGDLGKTLLAVRADQ